MDIDDIRKMLKEKLKQMQKPGYFEQIFDGYLVKESKEFKSFKVVFVISFFCITFSRLIRP